MALGGILTQGQSWEAIPAWEATRQEKVVRLPDKFSCLSFYLKILLLLLILINCLLYVFNLFLSLISHLIYNLIILFSL